MPTLPQQQIADLCRQYGVLRLDLFGSAARGEFIPGRSDNDLLVGFSNPMEPGYASRYLAFAEALESLLAAPVDLLTPRALQNPFLRASIEHERLPVFAA
jgi:predicted nucleotidyltransferase